MPATAKVGTRAVVVNQRSGQGRPSDPILWDELRVIASSSSHHPSYSSTQHAEPRFLGGTDGRREGEVPAGREDEFTDVAAEYMAHQLGFGWTRLHRRSPRAGGMRSSTSPRWTPPEQILAAISTDELAALTAPMKDFPAAPTLYRVVRETGD